MTMSALKQYLDLYRDHRELICKGSAGCLNEKREAAYNSLKTKELPKIGSEDFPTMDLDGMLAPDYGLNLGRLPMDVNPAASFKCDVPNLSTSLFMLVNDKWACTSISFKGLPDGVVCMSLAKAAVELPHIMDKYYGSIADMDNPLVALNTMLAQDGFLLYVPEGVKVEKPVQLISVLNSLSPMMAVRRLLIVAEKEAEVKILVCDHTQVPNVDFLSLQVTEIVAGEGAVVDFYDMEESSEKTHRLSTLFTEQGSRSNVLIDGITLFNGETRNEYYCTFCGEEASLRLLGMGIEDKGRKLDTFSVVNHNVGKCSTEELFKYVVDDKATGTFSGKIYVAEGAAETEAYQANRSIVGSDEAHMYSKPQLEIYNDDVKCSHGTAIGSLDETQLFYMRTRGISEQEAKLLLKQAFMADVIEGVRLEVLKDRLTHLVERRFAGEQLSCASCGESCFGEKKA